MQERNNVITHRRNVLLKPSPNTGRNYHFRSNYKKGDLRTELQLKTPFLSPEIYQGSTLMNMRG